MMKKISSWGRLNATQHQVINLSYPLSLTSILTGNKKALPYGMGRSYGDVCLNPGGKLLVTQGLDKFLHFSPKTGRLICEAGVLLKDIQELMLPRGWTLAVTPGTLWVTVGGAIANDVHGKNQPHFGTFGEHVCSLRLRRMDGEIINCSPDHQSDWFAATVGGIGLTGLIESAEIQLRSISTPWIETNTTILNHLNEFPSKINESNFEFQVAWLNCHNLSQALLMQANKVGWFSTQQPILPIKTQPFSLPKFMPLPLINRYTIHTLNTGYYFLKKRHLGLRLTHYSDFLYPLDGILNWNQLYGPKGFYQYQVLVEEFSVIEALLAEIKKAKQGSCMAVLKAFSERPPIGMMSFVKKGWTLAIDFPNQGQSTIALLGRLDKITREAKGRIYLAKDACMSRDLFEESYPNFKKFLKYRDPNITSALAKRLID